MNTPETIPPHILCAIIASESERLNLGEEDLGFDDAYIAYFPHYSSATPGYIGPLVSVVWPADAGAVSTFILKQGRWAHCASSSW